MFNRFAVLFSILVVGQSNYAVCQDTLAVLYFSNIPATALKTPLVFNSVEVLDERSSTQPFYNFENGVKPRLRVNYEPGFQQELECYLNSLLPSGSSGRLTAIFHVKELRVYNQPDYSFRDEKNSYVQLSTQQHVKLNVDVYFKYRSALTDSVFYYRTFNRFFIFKGLGFTKRAVIKALRDLLMSVSDTTNSEAQVKSNRSVAKNSIGVLGDNIFQAVPSSKKVDLLANHSNSDSVFTYSTYQDFIENNPDNLSCQSKYDSTTGCYRLFGIPRNNKSYAAFARKGQLCFKRVFGNYFWLMSKADSGFYVVVPLKFPDIYSLYSFIESGRGYTKSLGSANNVLQLLILGVMEATISESAYQRKLKTMLSAKQLKEVTSLRLPIDSYSGDILY